MYDVLPKRYRYHLPLVNNVFDIIVAVAVLVYRKLNLTVFSPFELSWKSPDCRFLISIMNVTALRVLVVCKYNDQIIFTAS